MSEVEELFEKAPVTSVELVEEEQEAEDEKELLKKVLAMNLEEDGQDQVLAAHRREDEANAGKQTMREK
jgi:hypothetical protein